MKISISALSQLGQVKAGDLLVVQMWDSPIKPTPLEVKKVNYSSTDEEEIVYGKGRYFLTSMYLSGESFIKDAVIVAVSDVHS